MTGKSLANVNENAPRHTIMDIVLNITHSGKLRCSANNAIGEDDSTKNIIGIGETFKLSLIPKSWKKRYNANPIFADYTDSSAPGFVAEGPVDPIEKDDVEYLCAVTKSNYTDNSKWYFKNISGDITRRIPAEDIKGIFKSKFIMQVYME